MHRTLQRALLEHLWLRWAALLLALGGFGGAAIAEAAYPEGLMAPIAGAVITPAVIIEEHVVWDGVDIDGDTTADFVNPTGQAPREHDAYGHGYFGASRDGGSRHHQGVDYAGVAGQDVVAPISGYVTRIGYAYYGAPNFRYVEISNPALDFEARVFYVDPDVRVGDVVAVGDVIGQLADLTRRYPHGITNHVHLEIRDQTGRRIDATKVIIARVETVRREI